MRINHIALWANNIECLKDFYVHYFNAIAGEKYHNLSKNFMSYFLTFSDGGARLEIMNSPNVTERNTCENAKGFCHIAISVGSREKVDELTETLRSDGFTIVGNPRTTGDGYYESLIADPEGNRVEITI